MAQSNPRRERLVVSSTPCRARRAPGAGGRRPRCSTRTAWHPRRGRASWGHWGLGLRCCSRQPRSPCEQFLEGGVLTDRIEVGIAFEEWAGPLGEFNCAPEVRDGVVVLAGEAFAASDVVEQV